MNRAAVELSTLIAPWLNTLTDNDLIVQIGACVGGTPPHDEIDPVFRILLEKRAAAILIEPLPEEFEELLHYYRKHADPLHFARLSFLRAAVVESDAATAFVIRGVGRTRALSTLATDRGYLLESDIPAVELRVLGVTLRTVLRLAPLHRRWGWLQIDIEGHELRILKQIPELEERPMIISFEHLHMLSAEKEEAARLLTACGYVEAGWMTDDAVFIKSCNYTL